MPAMAEIAVEAAAVARSRRRDSGMRTVMEILRLQEGGENGGRLSQNADGYVTLSHSRHERHDADCSTVSTSSGFFNHKVAFLSPQPTACICHRRHSRRCGNLHR